jgi:hypothetical protein
MSPSEEELQAKIERGEIPAGKEIDVKAYQSIFRALKKDPGYDLGADFASRVALKIQRRQQSQLSKDYFWFGAGLFFLAIAFLATVLFTGFRLDFGFLNVMSDYKGLAIFGIAFIIFLNWLDKRLIKEKHLQHRS